jgi:hypothetical protein
MKRLWILLFVCAAAATPASATQLLPATLEEMAAAADLVVIGRLVGEGQGRFDPHCGMVLTHATILVDEVLKGEVKGRAVPLVVPGGTDGVDWTQVPGAPEPGPPGTTVVAFLYADRGRKMSNVVFWQGLFHIDKERIVENGREAEAFLEEVRAALRAIEGGQP